jgi:uncharacterized protein (DUF488 family)
MNFMAHTIYTIGHSTHPIDTFIDLLKANGIVLLADVRTMPRSRWNPQFNSEALAASLENAGIDYIHIKALGGMRKPHKDSQNMGWRNEGFRGYADYMQTPEFEQALEKLIELSKEKTTAIMCAESVPWRCHRSLIADALTARQIPVLNIMPDGKISPHQLTAFAKVKNGRITYPLTDDLFSQAREQAH